MAASWSVALEPVADNGRSAQTKNKSGLGVVLTDGEARVELCRVAFDRSAAKKEHRDMPFEAALTDATERAQRAAEAVNDMLDEFERQRAEDLVKAREKIQEILGKPSKSLV